MRARCSWPCSIGIVLRTVPEDESRQCSQLEISRNYLEAGLTEIEDAQAITEQHYQEDTGEEARCCYSALPLYISGKVLKNVRQSRI